MQRLISRSRRAPGADIDPGISSYLDVLRIVAALTVALSHYIPVLFGTDPTFIPGNDAVIIFFVMSGYVIAYVSEQRERTLERFAIHRLARLWSVLVPSLILSLVAAVLVGNQTVAAAPAMSSPAAFTSASLKTSFFWVRVGSAPRWRPTTPQYGL